MRIDIKLLGIKTAISLQIQEAVKKKKLTQSDIAKKMQTSRTAWAGSVTASGRSPQC